MINPDKVAALKQMIADGYNTFGPRFLESLEEIPGELRELAGEHRKHLADSLDKVIESGVREALKHDN